MTFEEFLNEAWSLHGTQPESILSQLKPNFSLLNSSDEVTQIGHLITHISGEHLGEWGTGLRLLQDLRTIDFAKDLAALNRFAAVLSLAEDPNFPLEDFSASEKVRIYAMTSSALSAQKNIGRSGEYLEKAESLCHSSLDKQDPAYRNLAVAANNLASSLGKKETLTDVEIKLMIHASFLARKFWEIAGTWLEIERAEYRLAKTFLKANILDKAFFHAEKCLGIISQNGNDPLELFFGMEVMGLVEKARGNSLGFAEAKKSMKEAFSTIGPEDQKWCRETLDSMERD